MGRLFVVTLEGRIYSCKHCKTHLALYEDIVSKSFRCRHGKAYLFSKVRPLMKRAKSTKKENQSLSGVRFQARVGATIGLVMKHLLVEVMQMTFDDHRLLFQLYILCLAVSLLNLWILKLVILLIQLLCGAKITCNRHSCQLFVLILVDIQPSIEISIL